MSKNKPFLVLPTSKYQKTVLAALNEFQSDDFPSNYIEKNLDPKQLAQADNFSRYVEQLQQEAAGLNLPGRRVPHSTFWLMDRDQAGHLFYVGRVDIRHQLTDFLRKAGGHIGYAIRPSQRGQGYGSKILELALAQARQMSALLDSDTMILTCNLDNLASRKIIEKNGGLFLDISPATSKYPAKRRYAIKL